jgi:hypothetical protein
MNQYSPTKQRQKCSPTRAIAPIHRVSVSKAGNQLELRTIKICFWYQCRRQDSARRNLRILSGQSNDLRIKIMSRAVANGLASSTVPSGALNTERAPIADPTLANTFSTVLRLITLPPIGIDHPPRKEGALVGSPEPQPNRHSDSAASRFQPQIDQNRQPHCTS